MGSAIHQIGSSIGGAVGLGYAADDPRNPGYSAPGGVGNVAPPPPPPAPPPPPPAMAAVAPPPPPSINPTPDAPDAKAMADVAAKQRVARGRAALTMTSPAGLLGGPGSAYANQSSSTLLG